MARKRLNPAIKRSRTRSGCLTCRDRHMKCDEQQPVCKNCLKSKRKCYRGIRLNFTQYTIYNPEESTSTLGNRDNAGSEEAEGLPRPPNAPYELKLLDQSITIASLYKSGKQLYEPYLHLHRPEDLAESDKQFQRDIFASFPSNSAIASYETETDSGIPPSAPSPSNPIIKPDSNIETEKFTENYDITNLLLHNSYYITQNPALYSNQTPPHANAQTAPSASITNQPDPSSSSGLVSQPNIQNLEHVIKHKDSIRRHMSPLQDLPHAEIRQMPDHSRRSSFPSLPQAGMSSQYNQPDDQSHADHRRSYPSMSFPSIPEDMPASISHSETSFDQLLQDNHTRSSYPQNVNVHVYISLIEKERYYWLLDLFNELNIWKSVVPTYCLRELETGTSNNSLLINSLLNCSIYSNIRVEELLEQQKSEWYRARDLDITQTELKVFENLLISIVLMLTAINLKSNKHIFTTFTKIILNNQIKIFNKIIQKLEPVLSSAKFHTILLINSIQSIMILKQILIKKFELDSIRASADQDKDPGIIQFSNPFASNTTFTDSYKKEPVDLHEQDQHHEQPEQEQTQQFDVLVASEDLREEIVYPNPTEALDTFVNPEVKASNEQENGAILSNFLELNRFEVSKLNNSFEDFNIPIAYTSIAPRSSLGEDQPHQEREADRESHRESHRESQPQPFQQLQSDSKYKTDSMKLRDYAWYLIKLSYVIRHPECDTISIDYNYIYKEDNLILPTNEELDSPQSKPPPSIDIDEDRPPNESDPRPVSSTHRIVFPNERGVAINLLREYINKLINYDSAKSIGESNSKISKIFKLIDESMIEQPVKMCWRDGFDWTLTNISNDEYDFSLGKRKDQIADIN